MPGRSRSWPATPEPRGLCWPSASSTWSAPHRCNTLRSGACCLLPIYCAAVMRHSRALRKMWAIRPTRPSAVHFGENSACRRRRGAGTSRHANKLVEARSWVHVVAPHSAEGQRGRHGWFAAAERRLQSRSSVPPQLSFREVSYSESLLSRQEHYVANYLPRPKYVPALLRSPRLASL